MIATRVLALCTLTAIAAAPRGGAAQDRRRIDTTFAFSSAGTLSVGRGGATIRVTGWDQSTMKIHASSDEGALHLDATPNRVTIEATRQTDDVEIEIMVPRGVHVIAHTNSGDITIRGTRGAVETQASSGDVMITDATDITATALSGDVDARQISGGLTVTTMNGDVTAIDVRGAIEATAISGNIDVSRSSSKSVRAGTTNGDVSFDGALQAGGRYELSTHSGDISLVIPKTSSAALTVTTWSGTIDSDFPITLPAGSTTGHHDITKRYTFTLGAGSSHVTLESFSGDITLSASGAR